MTTIQTRPRPTTHVAASPDIGPSPKAAIGWLAGGAGVTFVVSWLGTTLLGLHHDLYYLIYFTFALGYLAWFAARSQIAWREVLRRNIWWSLGVGVVVAFAVARQVMSGDGTPHPQGGFFGFELVWRGVVYGAVDALILFVFPAVAAYLVLRGNRKGPGRKAAFAGLVLALSLVITATYHLGYSTFRGSDLSKPLIGTVMMDVPTILTGNPAGAVIAHATVHTTADVHQYYGGANTNHFLPPELSTSYPDRPGGTGALAIAAGWVALIGGVLALNRRRIRTYLHPPA